MSMRYDETDKTEIERLLIGHTLVKVSDDTLVLDDGRRLKFVGNDGGCACNAGCYDLTELNGVDNIITNVEFVDSPSGDDVTGEGHYKIFVFADNTKINLATFEGTDGNGYYGTGYAIHLVTDPTEAGAPRCDCDPADNGGGTIHRRLVRHPDGGLIAMNDAERTRQTAEVLRLLDESWRAHRAGDKAGADRAAEQACELDVDCVTVVRGGIMIGEVPNPDRDPAAWADYVQAAQDRAAEAEAASHG